MRFVSIRIASRCCCYLLLSILLACCLVQSAEAAKPKKKKKPAQERAAQERAPQERKRQAEPAKPAPEPAAKEVAPREPVPRAEQEKQPAKPASPQPKAAERAAYAPPLAPARVKLPPTEESIARDRNLLQEALRRSLKGISLEAREKYSEIIDSDDQPKLAQVAIADPDEKARQFALMLVTKQKLLAQIAIEAKDEKTRSAAADRITDDDQALVLEALSKTKDHFVYRGLLSKVKDRELRAELFRKGPVFNPDGPKVSNWLEQHYQQGKAGREQQPPLQAPNKR